MQSTRRTLRWMTLFLRLLNVFILFIALSGCSLVGGKMTPKLCQRESSTRMADENCAATEFVSTRNINGGYTLDIYHDLARAIIRLAESLFSIQHISISFKYAYFHIMQNPFGKANKSVHFHISLSPLSRIAHPPFFEIKLQVLPFARTGDEKRPILPNNIARELPSFSMCTREKNELLKWTL